MDLDVGGSDRQTASWCRGWATYPRHSGCLSSDRRPSDRPGRRTVRGKKAQRPGRTKGAEVTQRPPPKPKGGDDRLPCPIRGGAAATRALPSSRLKPGRLGTPESPGGGRVPLTDGAHHGVGVARPRGPRRSGGARRKSCLPRLSADGGPTPSHKEVRAGARPYLGRSRARWSWDTASRCPPAAPASGSGSAAGALPTPRCRRSPRVPSRRHSPQRAEGERPSGR